MKRLLKPELRRIVPTASADFLPYDRYNKPIPGMSWLPLSKDSSGSGYECFLLRMEPGAQSRPHEHLGAEEFFVLDGELIDCDGQRFHSGDFVHFEPGSKHYSHTPQGCTLLVILHAGNRALREDG